MTTPTPASDGPGGEARWLEALADEYAAIVKESRFSLDGHPHRMVIPDRVIGYEVAARDLRMRAAELRRSEPPAPDWSKPGDHHDNACERRSGHEWPHCHCERRAAARPSVPVPSGGGVLEMSARLSGQQQCAMGNHVWTPWLRLPNDSYVTRCTRTWCGHEERFDL